MSDPIRQEVHFRTDPGDVYDLLLSSERFAAATSAPAQIGRQAGDEISLFGNMIVGRLIELVPETRIVQAWRSESWSEGIYSIVMFQLDAVGSETRLRLTHSGFPSAEREHLDPGWRKMYWSQLQSYLEAE